MRYGILYHLHNLKNLKNTHEGVLLLVKLQAWVFTFSWFSRFLNCTNETKSRKASHENIQDVSLDRLFLLLRCNVIQLLPH